MGEYAKYNAKEVLARVEAGIKELEAIQGKWELGATNGRYSCTDWIHDKWAFKLDEQLSVLNVNVGIDIYPYMIKECDLAMKIEAELKRLGKKAYKFL